MTRQSEGITNIADAWRQVQLSVYEMTKRRFHHIYRTDAVVDIFDEDRVDARYNSL
jgi:hypothetical protein